MKARKTRIFDGEKMEVTRQGLIDGNLDNTDANRSTHGVAGGANVFGPIRRPRLTILCRPFGLLCKLPFNSLIHNNILNMTPVSENWLSLRESPRKNAPFP